MSMSSLEPYGHSSASRKDASDDRWHVKLSSDDVKVMSLEQLDDAYRLSIVDAETEVWKAGMRGWQPLGVVAGLDAEPPEVTKVGPSPHDATPRVSLYTAERTPQKTPLRAVPAARAPSPPPPARSIPPPPRLVVVAKPAPPPPRSWEPAPAAPTPPPARPAPAQAAPPSPARARFVVESAPPLGSSIAPPEATPRRASRFGHCLLAVSILAGACLSAYRNDVLLGWATQLHRERDFLRLEARFLGGPAFGTLRAVPHARALALAMPLEPAEASPSPKAETAPSQEARPEPLPAASVPPRPPSHETAPKAVQPTAIATPPQKRGRSLVLPVKVTVEPAPTKQKDSTEKPRATAGAELDAAIRDRATRRAKKKASAASEYDPLNPNL